MSAMKTGDPEYSQVFKLLGGRTFVGFIAASLIAFMLTSWAVGVTTYSTKQSFELLKGQSFSAEMSENFSTVGNLDAGVRDILEESMSLSDRLWDAWEFYMMFYTGLLVAITGIKTYQKKELTKLSKEQDSEK